MRTNKYKIIFAVVLILGQVVLLPGLAQAIVSTATGALAPIPTNDTGSIVGNSLFDGPFTAAKGTYTGCNAAVKAFEVTDNASQLGFSFSSIIGGGGSLAVQLQAEMTAYNTYLGCLSGILSGLDALTAPNTYTSTVKQQLYTQVKADTQTYQAKLKTAQGKYTIASQNIWKALMITVLVNTTKSVADSLVNKLVSNYKITNIKAYTDSVATLMYDNQFLRDNFPNAQDQLMARAILTNPNLGGQILPGVYAQAQQNLGFDPLTLSIYDPNYYNKMAAAGSTQANPYYLQASYNAGTQQAHSNALAIAQQQINQGNGYKAPVNCAGSLAQQQQIDTQDKAAQDRVADRQALLTNLQQAQSLGQNVNANDLARAQADYQSALTAYENLPFTVMGSQSSGSSSEGTAAIVMCEAISSPAVLVNQGIDAAFKSVSDSMGQYNNSNLPGFISAISGIATQISSSLILGGITGSGTVNENQAINQGITAVTGASFQSAADSAAASLASGIYFTSQPGSGSVNLNWSIGGQIGNAKYVTITGPGITGAPKLPAPSGSLNVVTATGGSYLLTVYTSTGGVVTSTTINAIPNAPVQSDAQPSNPSGPQDALNYKPGDPEVAGAFISKPMFNVRGPAVSLLTRGQ